MKKSFLLIWLVLWAGVLLRAQPAPVEATGIAPLIISESALQQERTYSPSISLTVPGIDLVQRAQPRYTSTDDPAFAARDYNDRDWSPVPDQKHAPFEPGQVYWVRFTLELAPDMATVPVDLTTYTQGAMEIYLNGQLQERFGNLPAAGSKGTIADAGFIPRRHVRLHFAVDGRTETIAVRFALTPDFGRINQESNGFTVALQLPGESDRIERLEVNNVLQYGMSIGVELIILLLALVILLRSRGDRSWMMLAVYSLLMALVALSNVVLKGPLGLSLQGMSAFVGLNPVAYPLALLFLVLVMRAMFSTLDRRNVVLFVLLTVIMIALSYGGYFNATLDKFTIVFTIVFFFEVARQSIRAVRSQVHGRWIIATGAILFLVNGVFIEHYFILTGHEASRWLRVYVRLSYYLTMPVTIAIFLAVRSAYQNRMLARQRDELDLEVHERTAELRHEKERSDQLLLNILPEEVAEELKSRGEAMAKHFDQATILFTDFKGFTQASEKMSPQELVAELNTCFKAFDHIITARGIEKIKTIGDAYMCAGGLPDPKTSTPAAVVHAALEMQAFMIVRKKERDALGLPAFEMRVGIHTGPVVAGIVGVKKFQYDIWGDTVNTASRMESSGEVGQVNISESTYALVKEVKEVREEKEAAKGPNPQSRQAGTKTHVTRQPATEHVFTFTPRGKVQAKGKGELEMYFVSLSAERVTNNVQ